MGLTPVRLRNGLAHIGWLNGLGKRMFEHRMDLFGFEDLVH